jgi:hypothetical protein
MKKVAVFRRILAVAAVALSMIASTDATAQEEYTGGTCSTCDDDGFYHSFANNCCESGPDCRVSPHTGSVYGTCIFGHCACGVCSQT